jgi:hypothetical protein
LAGVKRFILTDAGNSRTFPEPRHESALGSLRRRKKGPRRERHGPFSFWTPTLRSARFDQIGSDVGAASSGAPPGPAV